MNIYNLLYINIEMYVLHVKIFVWLDKNDDNIGQTMYS